MCGFVSREVVQSRGTVTHPQSVIKRLRQLPDTLIICCSMRLIQRRSMHWDKCKYAASSRPLPNSKRWDLKYKRGICSLACRRSTFDFGFACVTYLNFAVLPYFHK